MKRLLDLFCCAGGAGMGYHRAGFEVVGIDIAFQKNYPFEFHQADALEYLAEHGHEFDAIHASPPCQAYTAAQFHHKKDHPKLIDPTRAGLVLSGKPWVIENVPGAPLQNPTLLCGLMFDLSVYRHRYFETSFLVPLAMHPPHHKAAAKLGGMVNEGDIMTVVGHFTNVAYAQKSMGIDWMVRDELSQAIPPAYTEFIGRHLMAHLEAL